jgi:hypothetical protein
MHADASSSFSTRAERHRTGFAPETTWTNREIKRKRSKINKTNRYSAAHNGLVAASWILWSKQILEVLAGRTTLPLQISTSVSLSVLPSIISNSTIDVQTLCPFLAARSIFLRWSAQGWGKCFIVHHGAQPRLK